MLFPYIVIFFIRVIFKLDYLQKKKLSMCTVRLCKYLNETDFKNSVVPKKNFHEKLIILLFFLLRNIASIMTMDKNKSIWIRTSESIQTSDIIILD